MPLKQTYIQYGVPSDWAKEYETKGLSAATFKQTTNKNLIEKYRIPLQQVKFVKTCLYREPINEVIVQQLLENNNFLCCLCKGTKSDAYIIHHLVEYSKSQDNSYSNLALLCPNDHDLAHRGGNAITNKITVAQIRLAKKNWESQIKKENKIKALKRATNRKKLDWKRENIFKELQAYTENDKDYFFGRSQEIKELLAKIFKYNIVGLFGESGTGKTSLLNAGLIPVVKDEDFIVISIRCLDEPIKRFREE
jgi:transcriptional regulator with PAS, ATPase and Fis domain